MVKSQLVGFAVVCLLVMSLQTLQIHPAQPVAQSSFGYTTTGQTANSQVSTLIQFSNGSYYWYYAQTVAFGNALNLTVAAAAYFRMTVNYTLSSYGAFVNSIGGVWNSNDTSGTGPYWFLWLWNSSQQAWTLSELGASALNLSGLTSIAWSYSMWNGASGSPYYPPTQTPPDPMAVTSSRGSPGGAGFNPVYTNLPPQSPSDHLSWMATTAKGGLDVQPVESNGIAYFVSDGTNGTSSVLAYNHYGVQIWNQTIGSEDYEVASPLAVDGQLIVPSTDGNIYSLNQSNGKIVYTIGHVSSASDGLTTSPVLGPTGFFILNCSGGVDCFGLNGSLLWSSPLRGGSNFTTLSYTDGMIYLFTQNTSESGIVQVNATTGSVKWNESVAGLVFGTPSIASGRIYFITSAPTNPGYGNITVHSMQLQNHSYVWNYSAGSSPGAPSSISVANGFLVFASGDHIFELNTTDGMLVWDVSDNNQFASPSPYVFGNSIFYSTNSNRSELSAVSIRAEPLWNYTVQKGSDYSLASPVFNGTTVLWGDDLGNIYSFQALQIVNYSYLQNNGTVNMTAILPGVIEGASISWSVGNSTATGRVASFSFDSNGTYPVTLTVRYSGGTTATISGNVTVSTVQSNMTHNTTVAQHNNILQFSIYAGLTGAIAIIVVTALMAYRRRRER